MPLLRRIALVGALLAAAVLSGCAVTIPLEPAPDANDPLCAEVTVRLPDAVADQERVWTDAQATGAWGDPSIVLHCGLRPPAPTSELPCATLGGVDWLVDEEDSPELRMISYGREPAVQVYVDTTKVSSNDVLIALGPIVSNIPASGYCTSPRELPG